MKCVISALREVSSLKPKKRTQWPSLWIILCAFLPLGYVQFKLLVLVVGKRRLVGDHDTFCEGEKVREYDASVCGRAHQYKMVW